LQNPSQINGDTLNNVRHETNRIYATKKGEYLKEIMKELETNGKNKIYQRLIWRHKSIKEGYQPRTNLVKDENGDLLEVSTIF
jgi:hypothetical protein